VNERRVPMKVKDLLEILKDFDPDATVSIHCDGGLVSASLDGTIDLNDGEDPDEFVLAAETT